MTHRQGTDCAEQKDGANEKIDLRFTRGLIWAFCEAALKMINACLEGFNGGEVAKVQVLKI